MSNGRDLSSYCLSSIACTVSGSNTTFRGINGKIEFFEHGNAKKDVLAKHHSGRRRTPSENFYCKDFSDIDFLYTTIGIFCLCPIETQKPKTVCNRWRQDRADGSCIDECLS